uniref:Hepcidin n=1 Tax=Nothobranchius furzeri TaxID=105023 RepID=A0A8C6KHQ2_NOTFU
MKSFTVAVTAAIMLTFICLQQSSAVPLPEVTASSPPPDLFSTCLTQMPYTIRQQREARGCRFCCGCCGMSGCGVCCPF